MRSIKVKRVGSEIVKILSEILLNEAKDSLLKTITITACEVSTDLSYAKVYFTSLAQMTSEELEKELNEAKGYLRKELAERIDLRHTPELSFHYDESIAYGQKIEKIIEELNKEGEEFDERNLN